MRHKWNERDVCERCGLKRDGCSAGRTGFLTYTAPDGTTSYRAGPCVLPPGVEARVREQLARDDD